MAGLTGRRRLARRTGSRARATTIVVTITALVASTQLAFGTGNAAATITTDAQAAAQVATSAGYRTGIAVLDLSTGSYSGGGDDTGSFASESVAKILIATELLATGQMTGTTETMAYQMITQSDDDDADALYGLVGGDDVINLVAARYGISFLGTPPSQPGWWGNTEISAKGMVYLYAAIAKDPTVGPWLMNAMANAAEYGADGTYQFFGIPSATTGAAIKQGWGDDGDDSPNAVFNSTGYVDDDKYAVAILTDGASSTYGATISGVVTAEAKTLMPNGQLDDPASHNPTISDVAVSAQGNTVTVTGSATDPDATSDVPVEIDDSAGLVAKTTTTSTTGSSNFSVSFTAANGAHSYTVTAQNVGEGTADTTSAESAITVAGDPTGAVSSVTGGDGTVTVAGVASDPNVVGDQVPKLAVSVDGGTPVIVYATAGESGTDTAKSFAFRDVVTAPPGSDRVTVEFLSATDDPATVGGSWTVRVAETAAVRALQRRDRIEAWVAAGVGVALIGFALGALVWWRRRIAADQVRAGQPAPADGALTAST